MEPPDFGRSVMAPQILADQLILYQPGADYNNQITTCSTPQLDFQTFLQPCTEGLRQGG